MAILALILLLVAVVLIVIGAFGGSGPARLDVGPVDFDTTTTVVFLMGMASLLLVAMSLFCFRAAARTASKRRAERKQLKTLNRKVEHFESRDRDGAGSIGGTEPGPAAPDTGVTRDQPGPH